MEEMSIQQLFYMGMDRVIPELICHGDQIPGRTLNLGAGYKRSVPGEPLGLEQGWNAETDLIPAPDRSVKTIHCYHFLEHIKNWELILKQIQRVLMVGGVCNIVVPYYNSQLMARDLTHVTQFNEMTWENTFANNGYDMAKGFKWKFIIHANFLMAVVERHMSLFTQLVKTED